MNAVMIAKTVAELYVGEYGRKWRPLKGEKEAREFFKRRSARDSVVYARAGARLFKAESFDDCRKALESGGDLYRATTDPWRIPCAWRGTTADGIDVVIETVALARPMLDDDAFWRVWEPAILTTRASGGALTEDDVASRIVDSVNVRVQLLLSRTRYAELGDDCGAEFWRDEILQEPLANLGLESLQDRPATFSAPTIEKEAELKRRKEEQARREEERLESLRRDLQNAQADAEYEAALAAIAEQKKQAQFDAQLSELERKAKITQLQFEEEELQKSHELRMYKLEQALELERRRPEMERAERERSEARLNEINDNIAGLVSGMQDFCRQMKGSFDDFMKEMKASSDPTTVDCAWGFFSDEFLARIGATRDEQYYKRLYARRFKDVKKKIAIRCEKACTTRNVVAKRDTTIFRVNQEIKLEFRSPIDGYATILNLGTNGAYLLLVPNGPGEDDRGVKFEGVSPEDAVVKRGEICSIPRTALYHGSLFEGGPHGWEEFVVIVTKDKPLFADEERFNEERFDDPFAEIAPTRLERVLNELAELDPEDYAVGTYGFTVVE